MKCPAVCGAFFLHFKFFSMSNKEKCTAHCKEALQSRNLLYVFNPAVLESYYRKNNGSHGNAFLIGIKTADLMIEQYKPEPDPALEQYDPFFN